MEVVMLGTGGIFSARASSSFLVDRHVLVDCPNGCIKGMRRLGLDPKAVDACLLTHFHGDHYFDMPFLLLEVALFRERGREFVVAGPRGVYQRVRDLFLCWRIRRSGRRLSAMATFGGWRSRTASRFA